MINASTKGYTPGFNLEEFCGTPNEYHPFIFVHSKAQNDSYWCQKWE
jgi:hypothetical protein